MKIPIIISAIIILSAFSISFNGEKNHFSNDGEWNKTYGWKEDGIAMDIIKDGNGYVVVGYELHYYSNIDDGDAHMMKIDKGGNVIWDKKWEKDYTVLNYVIKSNNEILAAGYKGDSGIAQMDFWVVKMGENGNEIWNKTYGRSDRDDFCEKIIETRDGYFLLGTTATLDWEKNKILLIKIDKDGNEIWNRTYGKGAERGLDIISTENGYIIAGLTATYSKYGDWDVWIIKIDENGNEIWNKTYGWSEFEIAAHIIETNDGYLIAGSTEHTPTGRGTFIIKIDKNGNEIWNKTYGGALAALNDIEKIPEGYILSGGIEAYGVGGVDAWLLKVDSEGNEIWNKSFGNRGDDYGVRVIPDGGYYIIAGKRGETKTNGTDAWIIKCADYPPSKVKIIRPKKNYLYIFDREIIPFYSTMIIGKITVIAKVINTTANIKKVNFYLTWIGRKYEYEPRSTLYSPPYEWRINLPTISLNQPLEITCAAYYGNAGAVAVDKIEIYIINL